MNILIKYRKDLIDLSQISNAIASVVPSFSLTLEDMNTGPTSSRAYDLIVNVISDSLDVHNRASGRGLSPVDLYLPEIIVPYHAHGSTNMSVKLGAEYYYPPIVRAIFEHYCAWWL